MAAEAVNPPLLEAQVCSQMSNCWSVFGCTSCMHVCTSMYVCILSFFLFFFACWIQNLRKMRPGDAPGDFQSTSPLLGFVRQVFTTGGNGGNSGGGFVSGGKTYRVSRSGHTFLGDRSAALPPFRLSRELLAEDLKARAATTSSNSSSSSYSSSSSSSYASNSSSSSASYLRGSSSSSSSSRDEDGLTSEERQLFNKLMGLRVSLAKETTRKRRITCAPWMIMMNKTVLQVSRLIS